MAQIILITGGSRSGKSAYAQQLAESLPGPRAFIATCPKLDDEMRARIRQHRRARRKGRWRTIEVAVDLAGALSGAREYAVVLVDCLTLWINNLMYEAEKGGEGFSEVDVARYCKKTLAACDKHPGVILFVTNEVGMGIVPENAVARKFRDLAGRCNQIVAQASDRMFLMVCGQPLEFKKGIAT
ncbi:MAG: bifunctional adenosylcobinamide kinase/adenosylcobinamide-phosphate guanylyltransferase [Verrucomicrobia bacterium]|nr:bifunctional adenosylcobinamide kinase/adenosylcobinamide-phosphate guanylyltransferase [Verrucomicrobiota bacterium]